jgi:superfamily I DNA/RNA helicase
MSAKKRSTKFSKGLVGGAAPFSFEIVTSYFYDRTLAHRLILGLRSGVGIGTCNAIAQTTISHSLNYRDIFYNPLAGSVFAGRSLAALNHARQVCAEISAWQRTDTLAQRIPDITVILTSTFNASEAQNWQSYVADLPQDMTLEELRDWLWADTDEQQMSILAAVYARLNQPVPAAVVLPARVRMMSMHGAKGLSARIVFIPGLEDDIFPGPWRQPYPGLVLEAARLLYVSMTRARAACILTNLRYPQAHPGPDDTNEPFEIHDQLEREFYTTDRRPSGYRSAADCERHRRHALNNRPLLPLRPLSHH